MATSYHHPSVTGQQSSEKGEELEASLAQLGLTVDEVSFYNGERGCRVCEKLLFNNDMPFFNFSATGFICSDKCYHSFWADVTLTRSNKEGGKQFCLLPCCTKPCSGKGDYCGKQHLEEHTKLLQCMYGFVIRDIPQCQLKECRRICATRGHSFHDFCCKTHSIIQSQRTTYCDKCPTKKDPVYFYHSFDPFYEFSNFYKYAPFFLDGKKWKTSEHFFQAQKFIGIPYEEVIRNCESPRKAFELARKYARAGWQRSDWEDVKTQVMYRGLLAKFKTHKHLRLLLHSTGNRKLVEHTSEDNFWGDGGGPGKGSNHLGKLLENVRQAIRGKNST